MVGEPQRAVEELARCLKPGGELIGTTFVADGGRRQRLLFGLGARSGHPFTPPPPTSSAGWRTPGSSASRSRRAPASRPFAGAGAHSRSVQSLYTRLTAAPQVG